MGTPTTRKNAIYRATNPETGETTRVLLEPEDEEPRGGPTVKKPRRYSSPYAVVFDSGARILARDRRLTGADHRVMAALLALSPYTATEWPSNPTKVAELAIMLPADVSRSYSKLVTSGLLTRPRRGVLAFNPAHVWRGGIESREEALEQKIASAQGAEDGLK